MTKINKNNLKFKETFARAFDNHKKNNLEVAENLYQEILKIDPAHVESIFLLGSLSAQIKKFKKAKELLSRAVKLDPLHVDAYNNLGNVLKEMGENQEAIECYKKVIKIQSNYIDAYNNLGIILQELQKFNDAIEYYKKAIQIEPNHVNTNYNLGNILKELNEYDKAINCYQKVIRIQPNHVQSYYNLGNVFRILGELKKAMECYQKAIDIDPNYLSAHNNLGIVLQELKEFEKAMMCYQKIIHIDPMHAIAHNNLGIVFQELHEFKKAIEYYEKAIKLKPNFTHAYSNILFTSFYFEKDDPKYYLLQAKKFRSSIKPIKENLLNNYKFNKNPEKLKIGFVSGDFKKHPISYFLLDTLKNLKKCNLELFAYSNSFKSDSMTEKLKVHFNKWNEVFNKEDKDVINLIREDGINILFDLPGHSNFTENRLPIFVNKPAPIQVSWAGYLGSTGLPEIDYIIGDPCLTPKKDIEHFIEKIFLLPNIWCCFSIPEYEIEIKELPAIKNGYITFGCFNNLSKINQRVVSLWCKILKSIPGSKIFLKTPKLSDSYLRKKITDNFQNEGVDKSALILEGHSPRKEFLNSYNKVDIALDPFPYSGGTTSFEASWMGTPVLTKKGYKSVSRSTESINRNLNMYDWVANDEDEYLKKAIKFSNNLEQLAKIKSNLRQVALRSPVFNSSHFAIQLNNALWKMWRNFTLKK